MRHAFIVLCAAAGVASAEDVRQLDAHEHGAASLNIAVDGDQLLIELESPAANIVGFEHAPNDDQQRAAVETAKTALGDGGQLFILPDDAGCEPGASEVAWTMEEHADDDHDSEHAAGQETETHSEFHASYSYRCGSLDATMCLLC